VTGGGSSALGSVAFAWNILTALDEPVATIVAGYGLLTSFIKGLAAGSASGCTTGGSSRRAQEMLARIAPRTAHIGRELLKTTPEKV
jgi:hypothetical protein